MCDFKLKKLLRYLILLVMLVLGMAPTIIYAKVDKRFSWYFDRSINGIEIWKNKDQIDCRIVISTIDQKLSKDLNFYQSDIFLKSLQENKKKTLTYLGIDNWTFHILSISETKHNIVIDFTGDYFDSDKITTYYQEEHLYGENLTQQILYTCPHDLKKYPDIMPFFNWFAANQKGFK